MQCSLQAIKTEFELGHCLRVTQEGRCECETFLTCAQFVTTSAYVPRLIQRRKLELVLAVDAVDQGWPHEHQRHLATVPGLMSCCETSAAPCRTSVESGLATAAANPLHSSTALRRWTMKKFLDLST